MGYASLNKLCRLAVLAFRNATRLHEDSVILFRNNSYPSAFGLSALSLEEVGKYAAVEDLVWNSAVHGRPTPAEEEELFRRTYDHRFKQTKFSMYATMPWAGKTALKQLQDGSLEQRKQRAFYVGLPRIGRKLNMKGRITAPFQVTKTQARNQITVMNDFFVVLTTEALSEVYFPDIEEMKAVLTTGLLDHLTGLWPTVGRDAKRRLRAFKQLA